MENFRKYIGKKISTKRNILGFTQGVLASKIGTEQARISNWERGAHLPDEQSQEALKELFKVDNNFFDLELSGDQIDLLSILPSLEEDQIEIIIGVARKFASTNNKAKVSSGT